jgi:C_GCAxxG_C_C family probable redox protein
MNSKTDAALEIFNKGYSCSQAVLVSHCGDFGLKEELGLKVSGAFGGGMGHIGETCGAVTGALMLIGLKYGKYKDEDTESKDKTYEIVKAFTDEFKRKFGSIKCKDLIDYDISIKEELIKARESGVFKSKCPVLIKESIELVEKYI